MKSTSIGQNVKKRRTLLGLSQEALAEKSGISLRTIQRIEKDETTPRGDTLKRLATALETSPDELIDWEEKEDRTMLMILNLSMLCFLFYPLLGIIVPLVLWISQKDTVKGIKQLGHKIINFQITLNLIFYIPVAMASILFITGLSHLDFFYNSIIKDIVFGISIFGSTAIKIFCVLITLLNAYRISTDKEVWYKPAIPFLR